MLASGPNAVPSVSPGWSSCVWKEIVDAVDPFLGAVSQQMVEQVESFESEIARYARYALTAQGKQIRPALVALSGRATGEAGEAHQRVAVIIEMVHLATLVHDDIMDEARVRRGRPTLASNWGNEIAVLLGDCLFAQALKLAASFPTPEVCRAVASATNTVCSGEILQTQSRHRFNLSRGDYFKIVRMKTGELFALSCDLGAYLNGADGVQRSALRQYGMAVGTAYQVFDDCLDLFGSEARAGKSLGSDVAKGKLTLPVLLLLDRVDRTERDRILGWLEAWKPERMAALRRQMEENQVLGACQGVVEEYLELARQMLESLPATEWRARLRRLCEYLGWQMRALESSETV